MYYLQDLNSEQDIKEELRMDFFNEVERLFGNELNEAVSSSDKEVIKAFLYEKPAANKRLETDGEVLNGLWSGGRRIAWWEGNNPVYREPSTRTEEEIVRAIKKIGGPIVKAVNESSLFEADDADKYQHVGRGRYKKKKDVGKEDTPTYKKEGDKFVEVDKGEEPKEKETKAEPETKPKPKEKETKAEPTETGTQAEGTSSEHVESIKKEQAKLAGFIKDSITHIKDKLPTTELLTSIENQIDELDPADEQQQRTLSRLHKRYKALNDAKNMFRSAQKSAFPSVDLDEFVESPERAIEKSASYMFRPSSKDSTAAFVNSSLTDDLYLESLWANRGDNDWFHLEVDPTDIFKPGTELHEVVPDEYKEQVVSSLGKFVSASAGFYLFNALADSIFNSDFGNALGLDSVEGFSMDDLESKVKEYLNSVNEARSELKGVLESIQGHIKSKKRGGPLTWNDESAEQDEVKQQLSQIQQQLEKLTGGAAVPQTVKESFSFIESEKRYDPQNGVVYYKDDGKVYASPVTNPKQRVEITNENIIKKLALS